MAPSALGAFQRSRLGGFTRSTLGARDARVRQGSSIVTIISSALAGDGQFSYTSDWELIGRTSQWYGGVSDLPTVPAIPESDATLHYAAIREQAARLDRAVVIFLQIVPNTVSYFNLLRPLTFTIGAHVEYDFPDRSLPIDDAGLQFGPDVEFHHVLVPATTFIIRRNPGTFPALTLGDYTEYSVNWPAVFSDLSSVIKTGTIGLVFAGFHGGVRTVWDDGPAPGFITGLGRDPGGASGVANIFQTSFLFEQEFFDAAAGAGIPPTDLWRASGGIIEPPIDPPLLQKIAYAFQFVAGPT